MTRDRLWHLTVAVLALIGLILEYRFTLETNHRPLGELTLIYLSFFTILGNALVMVMAAGFALGRGWALHPALRAATTLYIVVVAAVFQLLLAHLFHLSGPDWWGNMLAHQLVPTLWTVGWLAFGRHGGIRAATPLLWLIYPAAYGAWTLLHGALTGWYPYPFLSVAKEGMAQVAINMAWMALFFVTLGYAIRWIDGRLARLRAPA
ncbi:Pr6Pr family membrane protein [Sphingomonas abietis]|uniref:Pr6Pr family membrane protein n=1 Tax=Sphingomonas abietis TaxID=3012344 RepID=A0ABY7NM83_9SPHN|nr:Pr6Pr family membrane protein [Sphingomonas abietis]WBO22628.1 Pr6Pr family membrane protein [Sphingomonas abietis]